MRCYVLVWYGTVRHCIAWYGVVAWYGISSCGVVCYWHSFAWYSMLWYGVVSGMTWHRVAWCGIVIALYVMVCYDVVCCDMVWYGMEPYGRVWYAAVWCCTVYLERVPNKMFHQRQKAPRRDYRSQDKTEGLRLLFTISRTNNGQQPASHASFSPHI